MSTSIKEGNLGLKRLQALAWLDQSNARLEDANDAMKSFHWHLTKARQSRPSTGLSALAFSACDVREEIVAHYRLVEQRDGPTKATLAREDEWAVAGSVPNLISEEDCKASVDSLSSLLSNVLATGVSEGGCTRKVDNSDVVLMSVAEAAEIEMENSVDKESLSPPSTATFGSPDKPVDGLRSRRGKANPQTDADQTEWTVENEAVSSSTAGMRESSGPVVQDAIDLFGGGLAPRELQRAKEKAQEAMRQYVQAANDRRHLLNILSEENPS